MTYVPAGEELRTDIPGLQHVEKPAHKMMHAWCKFHKQFIRTPARILVDGVVYEVCPICLQEEEGIRDDATHRDAPDNGDDKDVDGQCEFCTSDSVGHCTWCGRSYCPTHGDGDCCRKCEEG